MSSASADPPMTDGANPRNSAVTSTASPAFKAAIGVAELTPSILKSVMALPKEISRKQRPVSAGFMKFLPRPPKKHLTKRIANTEPMHGRYSGTVGESESASSSPVTTALPSRTVFGYFAIRSNRYSASTAEATEIRMTRNAWSP